MVLFAHKAGALQEARPGLEKIPNERPPDLSPAEMDMRSSGAQLLHELSQAVLSSPDIQSILVAALKNVLAISRLDIGNIRLFNGLGTVEHDAYRGYRDERNTRRHRIDAAASNGGLLVPRVVASKRSEIIPDINAVEGLRTFKAEAVESAILVPIATETESLGIIEVGSRTFREFRAEEVRLLESAAAQIGLAVQKARLFDEMRHRAEQAALSAIAAAAAGSLEMSDMLGHGLEKVLEVTGRQRGTIRIRDASKGKIDIAAHRGFSPEEIEQVKRRQSRKTLEEVYATGKVLVFDDATVQNSDAPFLAGVRAVAWVPITAGEEVVGVLGVSGERTGPFEPRELEFLQSIGRILGVALQNSRLFQESQRQQEEHAAINAIAMATTESLHVDELLKIALAKVLEVTGRERGSIKLKDAETGKIFLAAHQGLSDKYARTIRSHLAPEEKASEIFESGQVIIVNDPEKSLFNLSEHEAGLRSLIWVPLKARGDVIGILNVSTPQTRPFTAREIELLKSIGHVIGIAVQNARLFEETERRAREQAALHAVTAAVGSSFDLDETLVKALDTVLEATGMDGGYIYLLDRESSGILLKAQRGMSETFIARMEREQVGPKTIQIVTTKEPLIVENVPAAHEGRFKGENITAAAWLPIISKNIVVGILAVCTKNQSTFPRVQIPLLSSIGNALGAALENARLFQETDRHLKRLQALREIDRAISSTLDRNSVLRILLEKIDHTLPYASATIRLIDRNGVLEPVACRNLDDAEWKQEQGGRGIPNVVFESRRPLVIADVRRDARARDLDFYRKHNLVSYVGAPLTVNDEVIGVLGFYTKEQHDFAPEEIDFLATLAGQAAIAIQNSQLYEEARLREAQLGESNRMLAALHVAAAAASQSLELGRLLEAVIAKITDTFGFSTTLIFLHDARVDEFRLEAYLDRQPDTTGAFLSFRKGQGIVGEVAASGKPMIFEDVQTDPAYQKFSRNKFASRRGHHFLGVFPIRGKLQISGVLACTGVEPRNLTAGERKMLEALTDQLAVGIENSRLYDELKQKVEELKHANKIKDEFLSIMSHELRTPLNVVIGYAGLVREGMLGATNAEQNKALDKLVIRTNDLLSMITSMLHAASIEANEVRVESVQVDLLDLLDGFKVYYAAPLPKPVAIEWDVPAELPVVLSDPEKLRCILQNLIGNAIKFTEKGHISVSVRVAQDGGDLPPGAPHDCWIEYTVADSGVGIEPEKLPVIFDKFRQVDSSETRQYGGVGLGLYIAKKFVELLGGKISVESAPGRGSTFTVRLPFRRTSAKATVKTQPSVTTLRSIKG